ncbi:conserved histone H3-like protein [Tokyovirus A1]|uniref:conserved histone H3-like protein n=1 Tax=Tokyovirus A1 TaxID=1826170 RepID=UPI0007A98F11|nr:conserved histone H3-like protein [Tokyovirus A1]BAU79971.1 conserved histone H3-like protein [Tokyovirus A1]
MSKAAKKSKSQQHGHLASYVLGGETQIPKATTQHLLRKAGSLSATDDTEVPIRGFVRMKLHKLLQKSLLAMQLAKRKTILKGDVKKAAELMHLPVFAIPTKESGAKGSVFLSCRQKGAGSAGSGSDTNSQEVRNQMKSSCLIIPKERFRTMAKEISKREGHDVHIAEAALDMLQVIVESCTVRLLEKALVITYEKDKKRVTSRDIETAFMLEHGPL